MSGVETLRLDLDAEGERLDRWFKRHYPGLAYGQLQRLLRGGQIRLDGRRVKSSTRLAAGQRLRVPPLESAKSENAKTDGGGSGALPAVPVSRRDQRELRRRVLFRDDWLIAIDKPAGLAVQGGSGQRRHIDAMLEALRFGSDEAPRLVHRLDKDTSGVLLLARHARAARALTAAFRDKATRKIYWAAVAGRPPKRRGVISLALGKEGPKGEEKVKALTGNSREAQTLYREVRSQGHAPTSRAHRRTRRADPGRRQVWRPRCVSQGRGADPPADAACAGNRLPASRGRDHRAGARAGAAGHGRGLEDPRVRSRA
jgi:23S rRNA pseudouridine955/2504/2580 synthase